MNRSLLLLVLSITAIHCALATDDAYRIESKQERNKAVAVRVFKEIFNKGQFEVAREIYAPDFKNHGLHQEYGLAEDQDAVHGEKKAFPDLRMTVDQLIAEGDLVTAVWTFRGTHTDFGYGLPPTGAKIEMRGITVWRIVDGRIRDEWTTFNELGAYIQAARHIKWILTGCLMSVVVCAWAVARGIRKRWSRNQLTTTAPS